MKSKNSKPTINWGTIKRNLLVRDTNLDSRFTSRTVKDKRKEANKTLCRGKYILD